MLELLGGLPRLALGLDGSFVLTAASEGAAGSGAACAGAGGEEGKA